MLEWGYECFSRLVLHYKEMTAIALVLTAIKILYPLLFRWLNRRMEKSEHRKRVKLWTDIGLDEKQAEEIIINLDKDVRGELKRTSLLSTIKRFLRKKTR